MRTKMWRFGLAFFCMFLCSPKALFAACVVDADCLPCEVCPAGTCVPAAAGIVCGTTDCDLLDTVCRDYTDVNSVCDGAGGCVAGNCAASFVNLGVAVSCGICKHCNGLGACINYVAGTACPGTTDCDFMDTTCRDYTDVSNVCNGAGVCGSGNCAPSYVDQPAATACGVCKHCNGSGTCINTAAGVACAGTTNCDLLDTACRDYLSVANTCNGAGVCGATCGPFNNRPTTTACGTNTEVCTLGEHCDCSATHRRRCRTPPNKTCTNYCDGAGACDNSCVPDYCDRSEQGINADGDTYDRECGDCDDNNALVFPFNPNQYCDCNAATPVGHPSSTGISELTGCVLDASGTHFLPGCLCMDGLDNDCNGLIDFADGTCPGVIGVDWIINTHVELTMNKNIGGGGVYVLDGGRLIIRPGVVLTCSRARGVHVSPLGWIDPGSLARIRVSN